MLSFAAEQPPASYLSYALSLVGGFLGEELRPAGDPAERVDLYYGDDRERPCALRVPRVHEYTLATIPVGPAGAAPGEDSAPFPFDVFTAMRFWLADEGHRDVREEGAFDPRGRLLAASSAQWRAGVLERPVVNGYLLLLRRWLEQRVGRRTRRPLLREGKRCLIALTHDVDLPVDPGDPRHDLRLALGALRRGVRRRASAEHALRRVARAGISLARREGRHWVFPEVLREEASHGFSSVFFFAATTRYDPLGHALDVGYDCRAPRFRRLMGQLRDGGAEIGLHIGFLADGDPTFIERERHTIEESAGSAVLGSRHHFFMPHPFWETLNAHGLAGLRYDTSVGFNESPGYRLGVALPLHPWNPEMDRPVSAAQIPTFAMDAALFTEPGTRAEDAVARVAHLVEELKRAEGVAALDWHEYTSWPGCRSYAEWGRAYVEILAMLAADPEVDVQPPSVVAELALGSPAAPTVH